MGPFTPFTGTYAFRNSHKMLRFVFDRSGRWIKGLGAGYVHRSDSDRYESFDHE
jgi:hypothetical protein